MKTRSSVLESGVQAADAAANEPHASLEIVASVTCDDESIATGGESETGSTLIANISLWLDWQSRMISGVRTASVFLVDSTQQGNDLREVRWPVTDQQQPPTVDEDSPRLRNIARQVLGSGSSVVEPVNPDDAEELNIIGCPVKSRGTLTGAVVFALSSRSEMQREAVIQLVQWCVIWLEEQLSSTISSSADTHRLTQLAMTAMAQTGPISVSGHALCNLLATQYGCSMVAVGLRSGLQVQIAALCHRTAFDRKTSSLNLLEVAMEECLDQQCRLVAPPSDDAAESLVHAHNQLVRKTDYVQIVSIPISQSGKILGVLSLAREERNPVFDQTALNQLDCIVAGIAPVLELQQLAECSVARRLVNRVSALFGYIVGAGHLKLKSSLATALCLLLVLSFVTTERTVAAPATIEGELQQAIVAHVDSYIQSVSARAGDHVTHGQPLATLNDIELRLEREKWVNEIDKQTREHQQAWSERDPAKVTIMALRLKQSRAQLQLIDAKLEQSTLRAPFDGYLISGDLSQSVGTPVSRGQQIFQIIPSTNYKLVLDVEEHRISTVEIGQHGTLRLTGLPGQSIDIMVSQILPIVSTKDARSVYRVEAEVIDPPEGLRPGLRGVAKIVSGRDSLALVWSESMVRRLRLFAWYFGF